MRHSLYLLLMTFAVGCVFSGSQSALAQTPESYKQRADADVETARQLMEEAREMLTSGSLTRPRMEAAAELYIRAGKLFEKAGNTYQALGPPYATVEDVNNAFQLMQHCIDMVRQIQNHL